MNAAAGFSRHDIVGTIYFIQSGDRPFVKVGWARDAATRLSDLQCGNPDTLTLLATTPGTMRDEMGWHHRLADKVCRNEWFHLTDDVVTMIKDRLRITAEIRDERLPQSTGDPTFDRWRDLLNQAKLNAVADGAWKSRLTVEQVTAILADKRSVRIVAAEYGVSKTAIQDIRMRRTWRHVPLSHHVLEGL